MSQALRSRGKGPLPPFSDMARSSMIWSRRGRIPPYECANGPFPRGRFVHLGTRFNERMFSLTSTPLTVIRCVPGTQRCGSLEHTCARGTVFDESFEPQRRGDCVFTGPSTALASDSFSVRVRGKGGGSCLAKRSANRSGPRVASEPTKVAQKHRILEKLENRGDLQFYKQNCTGAILRDAGDSCALR